jgi:hypothetical protein
MDAKDMAKALNRINRLLDNRWTVGVLVNL